MSATWKYDCEGSFEKYAASAVRRRRVACRMCSKIFKLRKLKDGRWMMPGHKL